MKTWISRFFKSNGASAAGASGSVGLAALIGACGGACTVGGFSLATFLGSVGLGALSVYLPYFRIPLLLIAALLGFVVLRRELKIGNPTRISAVSLILGGGLVFGGIQAFKSLPCPTCVSKEDITDLKRLFSPESRKVLQAIYKMWPELGRAPSVSELQAAMKLSSTEQITKAFGEIRTLEKMAGLESAFDENGNMKWLWPLSNENHGIEVRIEGKKPIYARCGVDALGISTMYGLPTTLKVMTPHWHKQITLNVNGSKLTGGDGMVVAYGSGGGCDATRFYTSQEELDEYQKQTGKSLNSLPIQAALKRGIDIFGDLLGEPTELASASNSSSSELVLTRNYAEGFNSGCEKSCAFKGNYEQADIKEQPGVKVGDLTRCPVSGVVFRVTEETQMDVQFGTPLYFCCGGCKARFTSEPNRFVTVREHTKVASHSAKK